MGNNLEYLYSFMIRKIAVGFVVVKVWIFCVFLAAVSIIFSYIDRWLHLDLNLPVFDIPTRFGDFSWMGKVIALLILLSAVIELAVNVLIKKTSEKREPMFSALYHLIAVCSLVFTLGRLVALFFIAAFISERIFMRAGLCNKASNIARSKEA